MSKKRAREQEVPDGSLAKGGSHSGDTCRLFRIVGKPRAAAERIQTRAGSGTGTVHVHALLQWLSCTLRALLPRPVWASSSACSFELMFGRDRGVVGAVCWRRGGARLGAATLYTDHQCATPPPPCTSNGVAYDNLNSKLKLIWRGYRFIESRRAIRPRGAAHITQLQRSPS